jgi:hypothetical protein
MAKEFFEMCGVCGGRISLDTDGISPEGRDIRLNFIREWRKEHQCSADADTSEASERPDILSVQGAQVERAHQIGFMPHDWEPRVG